MSDTNTRVHTPTILLHHFRRSVDLLDTIHGLQGENPWVQVNPRAFKREGGMYLCNLISDGYFREFLAPGLGGVAHGVQSSRGGRGVGSLLCVWGHWGDICWPWEVWGPSRWVCRGLNEYTLSVLSLEKLRLRAFQGGHHCWSLLWLVPSSGDFIKWRGNGPRRVCHFLSCFCN